jgi:methionyl-tRNA synthetase
LAPKVFAQLGVADETLQTWESIQSFGQLKAGGQVQKGEALFPRIVQEEIAEKTQPKPAEKPMAPQPEAIKANGAISLFRIPNWMVLLIPAITAVPDTTEVTWLRQGI